MASPKTTAQACDPFADRRVYPRVPVALPAFVQCGAQRHYAQIVDLSAGGAKLSGATSLPIGSAVIVDCGGLCRPATVRWGNEGLVGVCFESELDPRDLAALVDRSQALATRMNARE